MREEHFNRFLCAPNVFSRQTCHVRYGAGTLVVEKHAACRSRPNALTANDSYMRHAADYVRALYNTVLLCMRMRVFLTRLLSYLIHKLILYSIYNTRCTNRFGNRFSTRLQIDLQIYSLLDLQIVFQIDQ